MKKVYSMIIALLVSLTMIAGEVTEQQAMQKAQQFMQSKQFMQKNLRRAPSAGAVDNSYYVFNVEDCQGFVIVAADDCMPDILGYSDKGHFDLSKAPDNVKWLMDYYSKIAKSLKDNPTKKASRRVSTERPEVQPLIKTTWDQGSPYNLHCPEINGNLAPTGCVATAMAQVINYHQWPLEEVKAMAGYTTEDNVEATALPAKKFNWYNMTEDDIAWLMRYCGQSVMMEYKISESSAAPGNIPNVLISFFGYSKSTKLVTRELYSDPDWEDVMYNEVNLGRPVIYSGFQGDGSGHSFVVHGYRDGMFMVNWGWSGNFDGYFALTNLAPNEFIDFSDNQNAVIGIQPAVASSGGEGISMTINVEEAGSLSSYISDDIKYSISNLTLTGELNGTDFQLIRDMAGNNSKGEVTEGKLKYLDLSDVTIIEGGEPYIDTQDICYFMKDNNRSIYVESPKQYSSSNKISAYLFAGCTSLKYIRIPEKTIEIETKAFDGTNLKEIFIPKSVTKIDNEAFNNLFRDLSSISIAEDNPVYTTMGNYNVVIEKETGKLIIAFCSTTIVPEGVKIIGTNAFKGCSTNGGIWPKLPTSLETIEDYGMSWCNGRTVFIPKNVSKIGTLAIPSAGCLFIIVDKDNSVYDSRNDCNAIMETASNTLIYGCQFTEIPVDAISIADHSIPGSDIKHVVIPESVKSIGEYAFGWGGEGLETVTVLNPNPIEIPENTFNIAVATAKLIVPDGSKEKYENAIGWKEFTTIIESSSYSKTVTINVLPAGSLPSLISQKEKFTIDNLKLTGELNGTDLNFLHEMMGYNSPVIGSLKYLDMSDTKIVEGGNDGHFSQEDVLGEYVFGGSPSLKQLVLPKTLRRIGRSAFQDQLFKSIVLPKSVVELGDYVFYYCPLESIIVEEGNPVFDSRDNCNAIIETATNTLRVGCRKTVIPNSVRVIGQTAFGGKDGLISISIPEGVTSIENYAFWAVNDLTSVHIPKSVVNFSLSPFGGCTKITSFTIDPENPAYDSRNNCNGIIETATNTLVQGFANTTIPEGITTIGERAFTMQEFLTSIEIPNSVTDIKPRAFQFSHQLGKVTCHIKKPLTISNTVFETDNISNAILYVPYGTKAAYASTPGWDVFGEIIEMEPDDSYQDNSASIATADLGKHYVAKNGEVEVPISITGEGIVPVTSIDYTINNSAEQHLEIEPVSYMQTSEVMIPFAADASIGEVVKTLKITKVNGVTNECTDNITATGTLVTVTKKPKIVPVVEEYTGTWCGWCSRGYVGLKMLNKQFGKDVITIAIHDGGDNEPMMLPEYRSTSGSYPSCQINRGELMDPYYGTGQKAFGIKREVEAARRDYALGSIEMTANWTDDTRSAIDIKTTTTFVEDVAESPYQLGYILLENGVKGSGDEWAQSNYYAGSNTGDENLKGLTSKPSKITDMKYDNVPVQVWEPMTGVAGTIPATITHDVPMEYTFKVDISGNTRIQNKNRLTVVVLLLDKTNGKIVNAAKFSLAPAVTITAKSYTREYGEANPTFGYYTVEGVELDGTPDIMCEATATSPVGTYPIIISKGNISNDNDTYIDGTLTITKAPLTITAKSYTITQGDALPTFDVEYSGFKNNETADILTKKPTLTTSVTSSSEPGTFDIVASGAEAQNYEISYVKGTLTINPGVYKLIYKVDGEVYKSYDVVYGDAITPEPEPTKEGYTFSGWSEIPETMPGHDVTITGSFIINKYKLTYIVDGEVYKSYDIEYGASITPEAEPTKEGYTFSGWSTIPTTMPAYDVTITGSFTKGAYKLIYMLDGVVYKTISYDYGDAINPEPAPTKEGYTFSGWSEIPETMPAHDVTVTGTFSINKYKLTYTVDGEVYKTYEMEYGATITPEVEPTKDGYTFSGWSEIPETMPAHDVTVTGTFTLDTGIEQIMSNANGDVMIFTIDGKRVDNFKKGMNVIRMKDGSTRKVVVK